MSWTQFSPDDEASIDFRIDPSAMLAFAQLSGDTNPLHMDDEYARRFGFEGRAVFGGLIVAKISQLIGVQFGAPGCVWTGVKIDFRGPLYIDEEATLTGAVAHRSDATRMLTLRLRVETVNRLIATGRAETLYRECD